MNDDATLILNFEEFISLLKQKQEKAAIQYKLDLNKRIDKNFKWYLQYLLFKSIKRKSQKLENKIKIKDLKRILIIRNDGIGDYVVSTPIFSLIKSYNPNVLIDVVTSNRNDFYINQDSNINKTYPVSEKDFKKDWKNAVKEINKNKYDLIFPLNASKTTKVAFMCSKINSGQIAVFNHNERKEIYSQFFDKLIDNVSFFTHWSEKMIQFPLQTIDFGSVINPLEFKSYIHFTETGIQNALDILKENNLRFIKNDNSPIYNKLNILENQGESEYVTYCISAFSPGRSLSLEKNIELIKIILEVLPDKKILVSASPSDYNKLNTIINIVDNEKVIPLRTDFFAAIALFAGSKYLISPDTANSHIAASANVPTLVFYHEISFMYTWFNNSPKCVLIANKESKDMFYLSGDIFKAGLLKLIN
jgi:ADP-heptose:LPS heptosyltransferase